MSACLGSMMVKRTLACLLLAAALCAGSAPALAVTIPWTTETTQRGGRIEIPLSLHAFRDTLAAAGSSGFDSLRSGGPQAGYVAAAKAIRALIDRFPWLAADGRLDGIWNWMRDPTLVVAFYGPGAGGYASFSWTRPPAQAITAATTTRPARWIPVAYRPPVPNLTAAGGGGGGGGGGSGTPPAPVPLPPSAMMLVAAAALLGALRHHRRGSFRPRKGSNPN